jgi:hypothetical protein
MMPFERDFPGSEIHDLGEIHGRCNFGKGQGRHGKLAVQAGNLQTSCGMILTMAGFFSASLYYFPTQASYK